MMHVGRMRMLMPECEMDVSMAMRLAGRIGIRVVVPMVSVVAVRMRVRQAVVNVHVLMPLGEMKPHTQAHQQRRYKERCRYRLVERKNGSGGAEERRGRKIGSGPCGAEMAQRVHKQDQAHAISDKTDNAGQSHPGQGRKRAAGP